MNNDPKDCPKRMEIPIRLLEMHRRQQSQNLSDPETNESRSRQLQVDQIERAIALLKANESMCECGTMPGDGNAAIHDLERSLSTHREMLVAFQGTPKGEYHARCIREIEEALTVLRNSMEAPKETHPMTATEANATTFTHPLFGTPQWASFVNENWSRVRHALTEGHPDNATVSTKTSNLTFSEALEAVKNGKTVGRTPEHGYPQGLSVKHLVCVEDMIATDWHIVEDKP